MARSTGLPLGIDVGGSGIKGAPVDLERGAFAADRFRVETPEHATPEAVCGVIAEVVAHFDDVRDDSPVGVTVPGVVMHGVVRTAANIDRSWIDCDVERLLEDRLQHDVVVVNDADAAGYGELRYGAAGGRDGLVIVTTLGTGIGSAVIHDGVLVPNSEYGHLELDGHGDAEDWAANSVRERDGLSWEEWAARLTGYFRALEDLTWPDLFVVGGGVSKKADRFLPLLDIRTPIVAARLENGAGIIGAAALAQTVQDARGTHRGERPVRL
ncbi:MAG TPA: ROK family protein [Dermatophilaceae bacterium]|nr:ROK family protein [Dermatophilaceae bacterium]